MKTTANHKVLLLGIFWCLSSLFANGALVDAPSFSSQQEEIALFKTTHNKAVAQQENQVSLTTEHLSFDSDYLHFNTEINQLHQPVFLSLESKKLLLNFRKLLALQVFPFHFFF